MTDAEMRVATLSNLFDAYSRLDFSQLCLLVNANGGINRNLAPNVANINVKEFFDTDIASVPDMQLFAKAICDAAYSRWIEECLEGTLDESEYAYHDIAVDISKDGSCCTISYTPLIAYNEN